MCTTIPSAADMTYPKVLLQKTTFPSSTKTYESFKVTMCFVDNKTSFSIPTQLFSKLDCLQAVGIVTGINS